MEDISASFTAAAKHVQSVLSRKLDEVIVHHSLTHSLRPLTDSLIWTSLIHRRSFFHSMGYTSKPLKANATTIDPILKMSHVRNESPNHSLTSTHSNHSSTSLTHHASHHVASLQPIGFRNGRRGTRSGTYLESKLRSAFVTIANLCHTLFAGEVHSHYHAV